MTTFVLVPGAWHGAWAWERVAPLLPHAVAVELTLDRDVGLGDHVDEVVAAIDAVEDPSVVLVGHSYGGLPVRQAADQRPSRVAHVVLVDGWAAPDGSSLADVAPFMKRVWAAVRDGWRVPAPDPATFGITEPGDVSRLRDHPLRTFTEPTKLTGAVDRIPGTGVHCLPVVMPFDRIAEGLGYRSVALEGPHDVMLTDPVGVAEVLLELRNEKPTT